MDASNRQWGITLLRVSLGVMWIAHAMLKLLVFTLPGTATYFESVGFPGFLAYPTFAMELVGGTALILGLYARQFALILTPLMLCAASVHFHNGWVHTSPGGGWEYPIFLAVSQIALWLMGDGALATRRTPRFTLDTLVRA
ncbi:DoxX family protein [Paraburkholderia aspalathi]|uniref:Putative oxidoreductase n=1 Tax=Paraburkholderia aspalathi TaxID=1324617 RepID=A0A1I7ACM1_9BURK|nr:DoxX family protein [Paraburkholderia aspalathi]SFT72681.1 putative oxidoreductase [Paraburkholderia aspalathi]